MRLHDGRLECLHCGETLAIPPVAQPHVTIQAGLGKPHIRVLGYEGAEIHRCDVVGLTRTPEESRASESIERINREDAAKRNLRELAIALNSRRT